MKLSFAGSSDGPLLARFQRATLDMEAEQLLESQPWLSRQAAEAAALAQRDLGDGDWRLFRLYVRENAAGLSDRRMRAMVERAAFALLRALDEAHAPKGRITRAIERTAGELRSALGRADAKSWSRALTKLPRRARMCLWQAGEEAGIEIHPLVWVDAVAVHRLALIVHARLPQAHEFRHATAELANSMRALSRRKRPKAAIDVWSATPLGLRELIERIRGDDEPPFLRYDYSPQAELALFDEAQRHACFVGRKPPHALDEALALTIAHHCELLATNVPRWTKSDRITGGVGGRLPAFIVEIDRLWGLEMAGRLRRFLECRQT